MYCTVCIQTTNPTKTGNNILGDIVSSFIIVVCILLYKLRNNKELSKTKMVPFNVVAC